MDDSPMHVRQSAFDSVVVVVYAGVVQAQEVHDRSMEVMHADWVDDGLPTKLIGGSVGKGRLDTGAGENRREAFGVVIAPLGARLECGHSAKLGAQNHKGFFK